MTDPLGTDLSCTASLDRTFTLVSGARIVAEAAVRRLTTQRGTLVYAPNYGWDVRELLLTRLDQRRLDQGRAQLEGELLKDDRVRKVSARLEFYPAEERLRILVEGETGAGPFAFTLAVSSLSVELLEVR